MVGCLLDFDGPRNWVIGTKTQANTQLIVVADLGEMTMRRAEEELRDSRFEIVFLQASEGQESLAFASGWEKPT